jgi:hypothetical protein
MSKQDSLTKNHLWAKQELINLLTPFTEEYVNKNNIECARLTNPLSTFPDNILAEQWSPLIYEDVLVGKYLISSWGRLYDLKDGLYQMTHVCEKGYIRMGLTTITKRRIGVRMHRLVGNTFIPKVEGKTHLNHKDLNKTNNTISNLEWCTNEENINHAIDNGAWVCRKDYSYFSPLEVADIKKRHDNGESVKDIAASVKRGVDSVSKLINGITYTDDFWKKMGEESLPD